MYHVRTTIRSETFYKVGITATRVKTRFSAALKEAKLEILGEAKTTLLDAYLRETNLQCSHGDKWRYRSRLGAKFVRALRLGPSECFSRPLPQKVIKDLFG